jgi:hypothetical protein
MGGGGGSTGGGGALGGGAGADGGGGRRAAPAFPLALSANRRYLVDRTNVPFLINQASSWGLIQSLSAGDATDYLDALVQRGFNTVMVSIISFDTRMAGKPPKWQGVSPFKTEWDFSTVNDEYFAHADDIINRARERGMLVTLVPSYLGYVTEPTQGWWDEMLSAANSPEKMQAYGRYLGQRYKSFTNILWIAGGDNTPPPGSELEKRQKAVIDGIKEMDTRHLWTAHWDSVSTKNGVMSTDLPVFAPYMNINGYYAYNFDLTYQKDLEYYNRKPAMMLYHLDQSYETEGGGDPANIRRKAYDAMLMGAAGSSFNAGPSWYLFFDWRSHLDTQGTKETRIWYDLFASLPWQDLVPDQEHKALTEGFGTWGSKDYVCAATTASGSVMVAYLPVGRTVKVALSTLSAARLAAAWFDPTTGARTAIGTYANQGVQAFTPPNAGSWVLLVGDAASGALRSARQN